MDNLPDKLTRLTGLVRKEEFLSWTRTFKNLRFTTPGWRELASCCVIWDWSSPATGTARENESRHMVWHTYGLQLVRYSKACHQPRIGDRMANAQWEIVGKPLCFLSFVGIGIRKWWAFYPSAFAFFLVVVFYFSGRLVRHHWQSKKVGERVGWVVGRGMYSGAQEGKELTSRQVRGTVATRAARDEGRGAYFIAPKAKFRFINAYSRRKTKTIHPISSGKLCGKF